MRYNPKNLFNGFCLPNLIVRQMKISPGEKICLAKLFQYCNEDGECFPKISTLAREIGVSERMAGRYLKSLKERNLIEVKRHGFGKSNSYFFLSNGWIDFDTNSVGTLPDMSDPDMTDVSSPIVKDINIINNINNINKRKYIKEKLSTKELDSLFAKFYSAYPLKKSKGAAKLSLNKLIKNMDIDAATELCEKLTDAIQTQQAEAKHKDNNGVWRPEWKLPSTWINQGCWEDEVDLTITGDKNNAKPNHKKTCWDHSRAIQAEIDKM